MELSFYPLTLEAMDRTAAEALCLFVGEDERPLEGLAGLADWRLAGGLSRLVRQGLLHGTSGEALLTPARRLPFRKLFLFGLGPQGQDEAALSAHVEEAMRKLAAAQVEDAALQLPARLTPEAGVRLLLAAERGPSRALVFGPDPSALMRALSQAARSRGAPAPPERRVVKVPGPPRATPPSFAPRTPPPPPSARPAAAREPAPPGATPSPEDDEGT